MQVHFFDNDCRAVDGRAGILTGMPSPSSPTVLRRQLGAELRRIRDHARRTVADVAGELGWSESKLSRIETAHTGIRKLDLERLLRTYGCDDRTRSRLDAVAVRARQRAWWEAYGDVLPDAYETYIGFEAEAVSIATYQAQLVPGLLQTAEYANAVMRAFLDDRSDVIEQRVQVRMARQAVLTRDPSPQLSVILDEAVLRRPIGGPKVFRRQLLRLIEASGRPTVTILVLPFSIGAHRALDGSFVLLDFAQKSDPALAYSEGMTGGVFRHRPDDVASYGATFEALRRRALSSEKSIRMIKALARFDGRPE
jgi:transcriptional regulator with XRE-family HTH domain